MQCAYNHIIIHPSCALTNNNINLIQTYNKNSAAAAEAAAEAEATLGNVLDDVGVDGMHHGDEVNDETWADVHAADGMAVVVDQAVSYYCLNGKKVCMNK